MKLALCSFPVALGNAEANANAALRKLEEASACGADLVVFPPFTLTGASCGKNLLDLIAGKASDAWRRFCGDHSRHGVASYTGADTCERL